jgi:hypothetical protein
VAVFRRRASSLVDLVRRVLRKITPGDLLVACKRCSDPTFFAWGEQANVGVQGAPTYVDFRAYAYVEAGAGRAATD